MEAQRNCVSTDTTDTQPPSIAPARASLAMGLWFKIQESRLLFQIAVTAGLHCAQQDLSIGLSPAVKVQIIFFS